MTDEARAPEQTVEPRTEAGRALLAAIFEEEGGMPVDPGSAILAIEREAAYNCIDIVDPQAAAVAAPPLDVERLLRAIERTSGFGRDRDYTARLAAEYARLSQPSPDEPTR